MIEIAVAQGVALLGKIGYDVWKRWLDGPKRGAAVMSDGSTSVLPSRSQSSPVIAATRVVDDVASLRITLHPGDPESMHRVFNELPVVLTLVSADNPELQGLVVPGQVDDVFEVLLPPGHYALSAFVFDDDSLATLAGVAWEHELPIYPGYDAELSLAVLSGFDQIAEVITGEALGTIVFDTGEAVDLSDALYLLGRDLGCDIVVRHDSVSRRHAAVFWTDHGWAIEDCGSVNGTTVNGNYVQSEYLEDGDIVGIGEVWFRLFYAD